MSFVEATLIPVNYESASSYGFGLSNLGDSGNIRNRMACKKHMFFFISMNTLNIQGKDENNGRVPHNY